MTSFTEKLNQLPPEQQRSILRKIIAESSLEFFAKTYLPHYLIDEETEKPVDFADFHREIFSIVEDPQGGKNEAWAAPRGHAKSTIMCTIVVLWWICYKKKKFVVIVSDTGDQADAQLEPVIRELEENELLREDFGLGPEIDLRGNVVKWTDSEIAVNNGVRVAAKGAGKSVRGLKKKGKRPDGIILDDLENDKTVLTKYQRDKLESWLNKTLIPMLVPGGDVYYIGTILHYDAVLSRTIKKDAWHDRLWRAIDKEGNLLWPNYWTQERLDKARGVIGSINFACEYLNEPLEAEGNPIKSQWFKYYSDAPADLLTVQTVDPAVSEKTSADYSAICTGGFKDGYVYVTDFTREHLSFNDLLGQVKSSYSKHLPAAVGIETVAFQLAAFQELLRTTGIPVYEITRTRDKRSRVIGVSVYFETGRVLFPRDAPWLADLEEELVRFPSGENDDMVDALVDLIEAFMIQGPIEEYEEYYNPETISPY